MIAVIKNEFAMLFMKGFMKLYGLGGLGLVIILWLLGPHVLGWVTFETMYMLTSMVGLVWAVGNVTDNLEKSFQRGQVTFLQTLPVKKTVMVHAKFISFLLLDFVTLVWIVVIFLLHMLLNGLQTAHWTMPPLMVSMGVFVTATSLLIHFVIGKYRQVVFYASLFIWGIVVAFSGLLGHKTATQTQFSYLALLASVIIYLICWGLAVLWVRKKGISVKE